MPNLNHNREHDFKVGDRVKVVRKVNNNSYTNCKQFDWDNFWATPMDEMIGKVLEVTGATPSGISVMEDVPYKHNKIRLAWSFPSSSLEPVKRIKND